MKQLSFAGLSLLSVVAAGGGPVTVPTAVGKAKELKAAEWGEDHVDALVRGDVDPNDIPRAVWEPGQLVLCTATETKVAGQPGIVGIYRAMDGRFQRHALVASAKVRNVHEFVCVPVISAPAD